MEVNLTAVFDLQLAAREMIKQGHGKIINVSSLLAWLVAKYSAYALQRWGGAIHENDV